MWVGLYTAAYQGWCWQYQGKDTGREEDQVGQEQLLREGQRRLPQAVITGQVTEVYTSLAAVAPQLQLTKRVKLAELAQTELAQTGLTRTELARAELTQAELVRAELIQTELVQAELTQTELARTELTRAELVRAGLVQTGLAQVELIQTELKQTGQL